MQIEVKGRNLQVTDEMREYVARRFDKISKQVSELAVLELEVADENVPGDPVAAEAVLHVKGTQLRAKEVSKAETSRNTPPSFEEAPGSA
jgi:putative sigma-54 modulation protein